MKPKRFLVFMFDATPSLGYMALGGWNDLRASFDTIEETRDYVVDHYKRTGAKNGRDRTWSFDHCEVVDLETGQQIDVSPPKKPRVTELPLYLGDDDFEDDLFGGGRPAKKKRRRGRRGKRVRGQG